MKMFWLTPATIREMYGSNFVSVKSFGLTHIIELLLAVIFCVILFKIYKKSNNKKKILVILTILIWIDEIIKYIATLTTGQWLWNYLPLHLCSINIFVCTIHTFTRSEKCKDILYGTCIPGAVLALIVSPWFAAPVLNVMHLHSYTIHVLLIAYSIITLADGYRPNIKHLPFNTLILLCEAVPIFFINKLLDTNFFYINKPEEIIITKLLADVFGQYYVLVFPILVLFIWVILYLPWYLIDKKKCLKS